MFTKGAVFLCMKLRYCHTLHGGILISHYGSFNDIFDIFTFMLIKILVPSETCDHCYESVWPLEANLIHLCTI